MTANSTACCPDQQKKNQQNQNHQQVSAAGIINCPSGEAPARAASAAATAVASAIRNQPIKKDESFCCKLSYADYCSIDGSRDLTTVSSTSNLQSPQHHTNCRTGKLAEKLFEDEDESDFCASCASHPKINLVLYCCGYIGFMIFAAWIFCMTERPVEMYYKEDMLKVQVDFLKQNPSVTGESCFLRVTCCRTRPHTVWDAHRAGKEKFFCRTPCTIFRNIYRSYVITRSHALSERNICLLV